MTPATVFYIKIADDANQVSLWLRPCSLILLSFTGGKKIQFPSKCLPQKLLRDKHFPPPLF